MKPEHDETTLSLLKAYEKSEYLGIERFESSSRSQKKKLKVGATWRFVRRNLLLILAIMLGVSGLVFYLIWRQPREYEGEFQLLVEPVTSERRLSALSALPQQESQEPQQVDYATLIRLLKSPTVLNKIVNKIQVRYPEITYNNLIRDLDVERIREKSLDQTKLIRVAYQDNDWQQITFILDELARGYIQYGEQERQTYLGEGIAFIAKKLPESRKTVSDLEQQLQTLQQQYRITSPETEGSELAKQARALEAQRLETQRTLQAQKSLYASLQQQIGLAPGEAIAASSLTENPRYQQLLGELKQVETDIATQAATLTDSNPQMQTLRAKQQNLQTLLSQETRKLAGQNTSGGGNPSNVPNFQGSLQRGLSEQLVDTLNEIQVLETRNQANQEAAAAVDKKLQQFPSIMRRYKEIQRKLDVATTTLNNLLQSQETLKVEEAQQQIPWQLAVEPRLRRDEEGRLVPLGQSRTQKLALGLLGGLLLGVGAALLRERRQNVFHSTEDLHDETHLPLLGALPFSKTASVLESHSPQELDDILSADSPSPLSAAAAALYTKLRFLNSEMPIRSLVVSSVVARDGKTTAAMHLAQAAASMGQRVLLVDANLAMPQLHRYLGVPNFEGLSEVLHKKLDPNQYIQRSPYHSNLFILCSGQSRARTGQHLASTQMRSLMEQFQNMFDVVIYDTAHLQGHADAKFLSAQSDGLLLVVGVGRTPHSKVLKLLKSLSTSNIPVLGTVANFSNQAADPVFEGDRNPGSRDAEDEFEIFRV